VPLTVGMDRLLVIVPPIASLGQMAFPSIARKTSTAKSVEASGICALAGWSAQPASGTRAQAIHFNPNVNQ
jgi:hypothetical protein